MGANPEEGAVTTRDSGERVARVAEAALARGIRVAAAESLTSGLLASTLGSGPDAAEWFAGAVIAYGTDIKEKVLGLHPDVDACSAECAEQLAVGARRLMRVDVTIATTGVGGPDPDGGHAPGTVFLGWATAGGVGHRRLQLSGTPADVLRQTVEHAIEVVIDLIRDSAGEENG